LAEINVFYAITFLFFLAYFGFLIMMLRFIK